MDFATVYSSPSPPRHPSDSPTKANQAPASTTQTPDTVAGAALARGHVEVRVANLLRPEFLKGERISKPDWIDVGRARVL